MELSEQILVLDQNELLTIVGGMVEIDECLLMALQPPTAPPLSRGNSCISCGVMQGAVILQSNPRPRP